MSSFYKKCNKTVSKLNLECFVFEDKDGEIILLLDIIVTLKYKALI